MRTLSTTIVALILAAGVAWAAGGAPSAGWHILKKPTGTSPTYPDGGIGYRDGDSLTITAQGGDHEYVRGADGAWYPVPPGYPVPYGETVRVLDYMDDENDVHEYERAYNPYDGSYTETEVGRYPQMKVGP